MAVQAPINYGLGLTPLNPAEAMRQGMVVGQGLLDARETGLQNQQAALERPIALQQSQLKLRTGLAAEADANAQRALAAAAQQSAAMRAAEMQAATQKYLQNPTPEAANEFFTRFPEHPLSKQYDKVIASRTEAQREQDFSRPMQVTSALEAGTPEGQEAAARYMDGEAEKFANIDEKQAEAFRQTAEMIRKDPKQTLAYLQGLQSKLAPSLGKSLEELRSVDAKVREGVAKAGEAEAKERIELINAENRRKVIDSELGLQRAQTAKYYKDMDLDIQRLGFDREKFEAENARALKELDLKTQEIPTNLVPAVLKMSEESVASDMQADDWGSLASEFDKFEGGFGVIGTVATGLQGDASEVFKRVIGSDDAISVVRKRYLGMMAKGVVSNLPKGAASDADIALVKGGFPNDTSDPKKLARFSRAMENVERASARVKAARAEFLARNKGAGVARGNFSVGGISVREGETEANVMRRIFAKQKLTE